MHPLIPTPAATARTRTQCSKFILIKVIPSSFVLKPGFRFILATTIVPNYQPKRTHGHLGRGTRMAVQAGAARVADGFAGLESIAGPDIDAFGGRDRPGGLSYNFGA
jgi:hypothetical protein